MNEVIITTAIGKEDAQAIAALARVVWEEHYTPIIGRAQVEYMLRNFQSAQAIFADMQNGCTYYLARVGGRTVGYAAAQPETEHNSMYLSKLYVQKEYRGRGIAGRFLAVIQASCRAQGLHTLWLNVNKYNTASVEAYRHMGFDAADAHVTDIGGGFVMDDYRMEKNITQD